MHKFSVHVKWNKLFFLTDFLTSYFISAWALLMCLHKSMVSVNFRKYRQYSSLIFIFQMNSVIDVARLASIFINGVSVFLGIGPFPLLLGSTFVVVGLCYYYKIFNISCVFCLYSRHWRHPFVIWWRWCISVVSFARLNISEGQKWSHLQ